MADFMQPKRSDPRLSFFGVPLRCEIWMFCACISRTAYMQVGKKGEKRVVITMNGKFLPHVEQIADENTDRALESGRGFGALLGHVLPQRYVRL